MSVSWNLELLALGGVAKELGVVVGDVALAVEEKAEGNVLDDGEAATQADT
jgi:hypothetical protein